MQRRRGLALLLVALLAGQAAAAGTVLEHKAAAISGLREAHEAAVSGLREKHEVVVSGLRAKLFHKQLFAQPPPTAVSGGPVPTAAGALTPTAVPAECASVAEVATQAGNFTALLAAAQVGCRLARGATSAHPPPPTRSCSLAAAGRWPGARAVRPQPEGHRVCTHRRGVRRGA